MANQRANRNINTADVEDHSVTPSRFLSSCLESLLSLSLLLSRSTTTAARRCSRESIGRSRSRNEAWIADSVRDRGPIAQDPCKPGLNPERGVSRAREAKRKGAPIDRSRGIVEGHSRRPRPVFKSILGGQSPTQACIMRMTDQNTDRPACARVNAHGVNRAAPLSLPKGLLLHFFFPAECAEEGNFREGTIDSGHGGRRRRREQKPSREEFVVRGACRSRERAAAATNLTPFHPRGISMAARNPTTDTKQLAIRAATMRPVRH